MFEKMLTKKTVRKFLISIIIGLAITSAITDYSQSVMADITSSVVRLHILANSDSNEDQSLKIKVRDDIIAYLEPLLETAENVEKTKEIIASNIELIEKEVEKSIKKHGYAYSATAVLGKSEFPQKSYEGATFPAGKYDALKIIIGDGNGQNWWCVLYPQLCFSCSQNGELPTTSKTKLKNVLTDDEYKIITSKDEIKFKLKIVEMFSR